MRGVRTGLGVVFGAAFGMIVGLLVLEDWWWGPTAGAVLGLIVGAIAEMQMGRQP